MNGPVRRPAEPRSDRVPVVTRRGWWAIGGTSSALLLALITFNPLLLALAAGAFGFVVGAILLFELGPARVEPGAFRVQRSATPRRVPLGTDAASRLELVYRGRSAFLAEFLDLVPDSFEVRAGGPTARTYVRGSTPTVLAYAFRPAVRGAYLLGPTLVTLRDPFGFSARQIHLPTAVPVTALPEAILPSSGRMAVGLFTARSGSLPLTRPGAGSEFRALRPYQPSDDIRHVAWKRSTGSQMMVREFHLENRQDLLLLFDLSRSMSAGEWGATALDLSVGAASTVASLVARQAEDRIGLLTYCSGVFQFIPPSRGPRHHQYLLENLALVAAHPGRFDVADALLAAAQRLETHAHILLFANLTGSTERLETVLLSLRAHGHRLYVFAPDVGRLYPAPDGPLAHAALDAPIARAHGDLEGVAAVLHRQGVPVLRFGAEGARQPVLRVYGNIKSLEGAR